MDLQQIKTALKAGKKVYWSNKAYEVIQSKFTQEYLIKCHLNDTFIGLTSTGLTVPPAFSIDFLAPLVTFMPAIVIG